MTAQAFTATALALPAAVFRETASGVEWLGQETPGGLLAWRHDSLRASCAPLREALAAASALGGTAILRAVLDAPIPEPAFVKSADAREAHADLVDDGDAIDSFVLPRSVLDSWRRSNSLT